MLSLQSYAEKAIYPFKREKYQSLYRAKLLSFLKVAHFMSCKCKISLCFFVSL